jgi:hypothetical protein
MMRGSIAPIRAFVLLVTLIIGLAGQAVAACATPMTDNIGPELIMPMSGSDSCPGYGMAAAPICATASCCVSPAIMPQSVVVKALPEAAFLSVAAQTIRGITVRPEPGPPRTSRHA